MPNTVSVFRAVGPSMVRPVCCDLRWSWLTGVRRVRSLIAHGRLIEEKRNSRSKRVRGLCWHTDRQRKNEERRPGESRDCTRSAQAGSSEPNNNDNRERPDNAADESIEALAKLATAKKAGDVICKPKGKFHGRLRTPWIMRGKKMPAMAANAEQTKAARIRL